MPRKKAEAEVESIDAIEAETLRLKSAIRARKKAQAELSELENDGEESEDDEIVLPGAEKIQGIIEELGGEGTFHVYRVENGSNIKMGSYDLAAWPASMESLVKKHGGGDYLVTFINAQGQMSGRITRTYDPSVYKPMTEAPVAKGDSPNFLQFMELMERKEARMAQELAQVRAEAAKAQAEATKTVIEALKSGNKPLVNGVQDIVALMGVLNPKRGGALSEIRDAMDLVDDLRGGSEPASFAENPAGAALDRLASILTPVIAKMLQPGPVVSAPVAPVAPKVPVFENHVQPKIEAPVEPKPEPVQVAEQVKPSVAQHVSSLKMAILGGIAPKEAASATFGAIKDNPVDRSATVELLQNGDWEPVYSDPELKDHESWIDSFRDELEKLLGLETAQA